MQGQEDTALADLKEKKNTSACAKNLKHRLQILILKDTATVCFTINQNKKMEEEKMAEVNITYDNFEEEVVKSELPVLLDFWAEWCGPCRMISPIVAEVAEDYEGRLKVGKVNVDEYPEIADSYGVSSIPMLVVMKSGQTVSACVGYKEKAQIEKLFEEYI